MSKLEIRIVDWDDLDLVDVEERFFIWIFLRLVKDCFGDRFFLVTVLLLVVLGEREEDDNVGGVRIGCCLIQICFVSFSNPSSLSIAITALFKIWSG